MRSLWSLVLVVVALVSLVSAKHNLREKKEADKKKLHGVQMLASWTEPLHNRPSVSPYSKAQIRQTGKKVKVNDYAVKHFASVLKATQEIDTEGGATRKAKDTVIAYANKGFFVNYYFGADADCQSPEVDVMATRINACSTAGYRHYSKADALMVTANKKNLDEYNLVLVENYFNDSECDEINGTNVGNYGLLGSCAYSPNEAAYFANDFVPHAQDIVHNTEGVLISTYRSKVGCSRANVKDLVAVEFRHSGCRVQEDGSSMRYGCFNGRPAMIYFSDNACSDASPSYNTAPDDCRSSDLASYVCVDAPANA